MKTCSFLGTQGKSTPAIKDGPALRRSFCKKERRHAGLLFQPGPFQAGVRSSAYGPSKTETAAEDRSALRRNFCKRNGFTRATYLSPTRPKASPATVGVPPTAARRHAGKRRIASASACPVGLRHLDRVTEGRALLRPAAAQGEGAVRPRPGDEQRQLDGAESQSDGGAAPPGPRALSS